MSKARIDSDNSKSKQLLDEKEKYRVEIEVRSISDDFDDLYNIVSEMSPSDARKYINKELLDIGLEESKQEVEGRGSSQYQESKKKLLLNFQKYLPPDNELLKYNLETILKEMFPEETISKIRELTNHRKIIETAEKPSLEELHTDIFRNDGFRFFDYLMNNYVDNNKGEGRYADISYYYRVMAKKKKYITANITDFTEWFYDTYSELIGKIKTKHQVENSTRGENYTTALVWFKSLNK